jgi:2'-5' RNA ligase
MGALVNYPQAPFFQGSIVKEYLLVINPGDHVGQQVMEEKVNFCNRYGAKEAINTQTHIAVANFLAKEEMEDTLLRWMHRIISSHSIFPVALNNYSGSPDANTIYLRVQDHQPFKKLAKELRVVDELVRSNGLPKAHLISDPQITIAHTLAKPVYDRAMPVYSKKDFHAEFEVKELVLLKRTQQSDSCKQVNVFRLLP